MTLLREASSEELDELFRQATVEAAEAAIAAQIQIVGMDCHGRLMQSPEPEITEEAAESAEPAGGGFTERRLDMPA